jgi:disulfide bond formation protein DsbB
MKRRRSTLIGLIGAFAMASVLLIACGGGGSQPAPQQNPPAPTVAKSAGNADNGKAKFAGTCTSCHGQDAKGMQGLGKNLHSNTFIGAMSDEEVVAFLKKGRPATDPLNTTKVDMPPKGGNPALSDQDLLDIVAFLRTLK